MICQHFIFIYEIQFYKIIEILESSQFLMHEHFLKIGHFQNLSTLLNPVIFDFKFS